jgi:hypothetical protein
VDRLRAAPELTGVRVHTNITDQERHPAAANSPAPRIGESAGSVASPCRSDKQAGIGPSATSLIVLGPAASRETRRCPRSRQRCPRVR